MKKILTGILALIMCVCTAIGLAACDNSNKPDGKEPATDVKLTDGVYDGTYSAQGYTQDVYIRFHEEGELFEGKSTFYFHAYSGSGSTWMTMIAPLLGTYTVLDEEITMKCWPSGLQRSTEDGGVCENRTADKTVVFYSLDGTTEYFRTGWDTTENKLLGIPCADSDLGITKTNTMGVSSYYANYCMPNTANEKTDRGAKLYTYYCDTDAVKNASIVIYHNGTYVDNMVTGSEAVEGTYTVSDGTYTLTAGSGATGGTLVVSTGTITFTPTGGTAVTMRTERIREAVYTFSGTGKATSLGSSVTVTLTLYDDESITLEGLSSTQEGTWSMSSDVITISVTGGDILAETGYDDDGEYYYMDIDGVTLRTASHTYALHTYVNSAFMFEGNVGTIVLYSDGTATFDCTNEQVATALGAPCSGTWTGRTVTVTTNSGNVVFTITETDDGYVALSAGLGDFAGASAPDESSTGGDDNENTATALYTLTGSASGYDASGSEITYNYSLKLNSDYKFELILNGAATAASGTWTVLTSGDNAGKYELTVTYAYNSMFETSSTWLMSVTYNSDYTAVTGLSVTVPAVSAMFISSAELTYSVSEE